MGHVIYFFLTRLLWRRNIMSSPPRRVWRLDGTGLLSATMTCQNPFAAWSSGLATLYNTFLPYSHLFFFTFTRPTSSLAESTIIRPICTVGPLRLSLYVPCGSDRASPDEPHEALRPRPQFPLAHRYHSTPGRSRHGGSASFLVAVSLCVESRFSIPVLLSETKQWLIVYVQSRPAPPPPTSR